MARNIHTREGAAPLFTEGTLFHRFRRFIIIDGNPVDRLPAVLEHGLVAPAKDTLRRVVSDMAGRLTVVGTTLPYDSVVFLHRYIPGVSHRYIFNDGKSALVTLEPDVPFKNAKQMGEAWPVMCMDEVYSLDSIPSKKFDSLLLPDSQLENVETEMSELLEASGVELRRF